MYEVCVVLSFSAAHRLREYQGRCEELHGHNWRVEACLRSQGLNKIGMCEDFTLIKKNLKEVLSLLDHKYLNDLSFFKEVNPTSENIAQWIYERLKERWIKSNDVKMHCVKVWETDGSCAIYYDS